MSSSSNDKYESASKQYQNALQNQLGQAAEYRAYKKGLDQGRELSENSYNLGEKLGRRVTDQANNAGLINANNVTRVGTKNAIDLGSQMTAAQNANAKKYANQQAQAAAAGTQSQATTAARAAGMNKAQAAMMGSQQNANAFQNAYGNAYNSQLGVAGNNMNNQLSNYNNAYESGANRMNNNINLQETLANQNALSRGQSIYQSNQDYVNALANQLGFAQSEGQAKKQRENQGISTALGAAAMVLPLLFSDERLKHYRECSKKVVMRTPSKLKALKITVDKGDK